MKKAVPFVASGIITGIAMVTLSFFIDDSTQANGTLYAGLIAAITIAAIPIYDIDTWSLTKRVRGALCPHGLHGFPAASHEWLVLCAGSCGRVSTVRRRRMDDRLHGQPGPRGEGPVGHSRFRTPGLADCDLRRAQEAVTDRVATLKDLADRGHLDVVVDLNV